MKAVIIAAGMNYRLRNETYKHPKTLLPFGRGTILSTILNNMSQAGITDFTIILGYEADKIISYVKKNNFFGFNITFIINHNYQKGNGLSVALAKDAVQTGNFILSMSDHIVAPSAIRRIMNDPDDINILLIDKQLNSVFDMDDATKVYTNHRKILQIDKNLKNYNGVDCGIFRLNSRFFEAMDLQIREGNDSLSAGIQLLIEKKDIISVFIEKNEYWLDIDTPEAYQYALSEKFSPFVLNKINPKSI